MSTHSAPQKRRGDVLFAVCVVAGLGVLSWVVITMQSLSRNLNDANSARDQLARQVQQLGASPVAGPPGSRGVPGRGATGAKGDQGLPGGPGPSGSPGRSGAAGKPGPAGSAGSAGPVGPSGAPGTAGAPGTDGAQGPVGPTGPEGPAGKDGTDGKDGADGTNGQPPAGWTWTDAAGITYTCTRASSFDPASPEYTCAPQSAPHPSPTPTPSDSAAALDPRREH